MNNNWCAKCEVDCPFIHLLQFKIKSLKKQQQQQQQQQQQLLPYSSWWNYQMCFEMVQSNKNITKSNVD